MSARISTCRIGARARLSAAGIMLLAGWCVAGDGRVPITQADLDSPPFIITRPGSYVVVENLNLPSSAYHGIEVATNSVTIDLNGYTLGGPVGTSQSGIFQNTNYHSLAVVNGVVRGWGGSSRAGIHLLGRNNRIERIRACLNGHGIVAGPGSVATLCVASSNSQVGITVTDGVIERCVAMESGRSGLQGLGGTVVRDCASRLNDDDGIAIVAGAAVGCATRENGLAGIRSAYQGIVSTCTAVDNKDDGIFTWQGSTVEKCLALDNDRNGIYAHTDSTIRDCVSRGNGQAGFRATMGTLIENCVSSYNEEDGIYLYLNCVARGNACFNNGLTNSGAGLYVAGGGTGTRVEANHIAGQTNGLTVIVAGNVVVKNSSVYNAGTNYNVAAGSILGPIANTIFQWQTPWANFSIHDN